MARSASKGIFPRSGIVDGHIITHPNGKRYQWNSSKGVWKLKSTMIDDSNFIGPQGIPGPTGATGATGPQGANTLVQTQLGSGAHTLTNMVTPGDWSRVSGYQTMVRASGSNANGLPADHGQNYFGYMVTSRRDTGTGYSAILSAYDNSRHWITYCNTHSQYPVWLLINNPVFTATGGTIQTYGGYKSHTFTASGTFTPEMSGEVDILIVAGGGGGGGGYQGGGGGAGGMLVKTTQTVIAGSLSVIVGGGGSGTTNGSPPSNGSNSSFNGFTAIGGGHGAGEMQVFGGSTYQNGNSGGSGGGSGHPTYQTARSGTSGQGNAGGVTWGACCSMAGGGGAGGVGAYCPGNGYAGAGGVGLVNDFKTGTNIYYAGGGAGANRTGGTQASGGLGGGGLGGNSSDGQSGGTNTGGGGGGGGRSVGIGGTGGSGIVIIRYKV
jgi:hypothetical protein